MNKKLALIANLIIGLASFTTADAAKKCSELRLDNSQEPNLLRPAFTPEECALVQTRLQSSGKFPDVFTPQGNNLLLNGLGTPLCFISNRKDPYFITSGIHATMGNRKIIIDSASIWTNQFQPNLPEFGFAGTDNQASVITQWVVSDDVTNKLIGKGYTTDILDTRSLAETGATSELNVIIAGTEKLVGASGSVRVNSQMNAAGFPVITGISGKICINQ
ncbi:MAG: hypothetical protein CTY19_16050 [Methylomonas sp.]|nr:MAG: hypothetical protein CTY19_16050 [Methylomonas sp.]